MELRLYRSMLTYAGLTVHTASSGPVAGLDAIYLELDDGVRRAVGEVRINCTYLNGYAPDELLQCVRGAIGAFDWDAPPETLRATVAASDLPAPVRMLFDVALWDLAARRAGLPLAHLLAGEARVLSHVTNQTLFLSGDDAFDRQVADYVARGFRDLKLRVGQDIEADRARHARIRAAYGVAVKLAADANGAWTAAEAPARLAALAPFGLAYVEQPIAPGDWEGMTRLAASAPMPLMLDESLASNADVDALIERGPAAAGKLQGHLKLIKLGGLTPALMAVRALRAAGIPFMIGQMNEGAVATAAALHLAIATLPLHAELYGADGIVNDPAEGLAYADGQVSVRAAPGLGLNFRAPSAPISLGE
ncbi:MAG: mandelate racemase/muconate lactonizing enzyme family protein [Rhizobiales bacterium]|nr:mandelate racemase/muconate lactonizing enzyme family protein [Hyphomicrobiales bacterium]OJY01947.1 MAG: mandelate racemase [Rhizobiales bacterium 63-22]